MAFNFANAEKLASVIEKMPHTPLTSESGFNMAARFHPCGTPACTGSFVLKGKASEIDRQLKAMCAVEARKGRVGTCAVEE